MDFVDFYKNLTNFDAIFDGFHDRLVDKFLILSLPTPAKILMDSFASLLIIFYKFPLKSKFYISVSILFYRSLLKLDFPCRSVGTMRKLENDCRLQEKKFQLKIWAAEKILNKNFFDSFSIK